MKFFVAADGIFQVKSFAKVYLFRVSIFVFLCWVIEDYSFVA